MDDNLFSNVNNNQGGNGVGQPNNGVDPGVINSQPVVDNQISTPVQPAPVTDSIAQSDASNNSGVTLSQAINNISQPVEPVNTEVSNPKPVQAAPVENVMAEPSVVANPQVTLSDANIVGGVQQPTNNVDNSNIQVNPAAEPVNNSAPSQENNQSNGSEPEVKVISPFTYFAYNILFAIPIIGLILVIVKSFDKKNINLRNFARSFLINLIFIVIIGAGLTFGGLVDIDTLIYTKTSNNNTTTNDNSYVVDDGIVNIDEDVTVDDNMADDNIEQGEEVTTEDTTGEVPDEVVDENTDRDTVNE